MCEVLLPNVPVPKPKTRKRFFHCKFGTLNCRTADRDGRLAEILREATKSGLQVLALQETKLIGQADIDVSVGGTRWHVYWSGGLRKRNGVGLAVRITPAIEVKRVHNEDDRSMFVDFDISGNKLRAISCYAPTDSYSLAYKEAYYAKLSSLATREIDLNRLIQNIRLI